MGNISKEILKMRQRRLELLQGKYRDRVLDAPTVVTKIADPAKIDELELQIRSIDKLLNVSLIPFTPERKPAVHKQVKAKQIKKKTKTAVSALPSEKEKTLFKQ